MRGLSWPLPSVVAGSFRTALVKAKASLDFSGDMPQRLFRVAVAGVFPVHAKELCLPAPNDAVVEPTEDGKAIKSVHRVQPLDNTGGCDFPDDLPLSPVMLPDGVTDFKPADSPAWWPVSKFADWLLMKPIAFDKEFFKAPIQSVRDHVAIEADRGATAESQIYASSNLNVTHLPRFYVKGSEEAKNAKTFTERFAEVTLSARVAIDDSTLQQPHFDIWHPLGGERRMVHWQQEEAESTGWNCLAGIRSTLATATKVRMVLATPAVFKDGWKPGWLTNGLDGELFGVKLKLVGVSNGRWKAVSGWSLAPPRGPKPIRRMVPAGSVYFFEVEKPGDAAPLADLWLQSVSDEEQERRDGFGLAVWGIW
jgi:CRISPR-associated protein Cmr3